MKKSKLLLLGIGLLVNSLEAQIGVNTATPLGTFHVDGSKDNVENPTNSQQSNDFIVKSTGDTGIGTTILDPSAKLQVNADNKGVLIPRVALTATNDGTTIPAPAKGLIVYNINSNANMEEGFYTNYGTPSSPNWITYKKQDKNNWEFIDVFEKTATGPVDRVVVSGSIINNIDLGMSVTVTVPANSQAKIIVAYSIPIGTSVNAPSNFGGYFGIRFLKNNVEFPEGSRKQTISTPVAANADVSPSKMVSIGGTASDTIVNNTDTPISVSYTLNGYVESFSGTFSQALIRFNMWSATGPNFNWGKGYMNVQLFTKPII
ncbi:hypothetical protein [Chryseobacterium kwangjuense]|uniref:ZU5 domain-containing protein n=1 Tax=Chryseobacterium kwangjuense TaxID=267125 RepID=A0A135WFR4_9FLAO|nr:hypothetical protein [Chryseobacterium kwangjuense]KXH83725.1 hypothetical protein AU378_22680 [Chryseobacterium kwangjuense]